MSEFKFSECVSPNICDKLANISFMNYKEIMEFRGGEQTIDQSGWNQLKNYCKKMMNHNYELEQTYNLGKENGFGYGRQYLQGYGLQTMPREFRGALCGTAYRDFDMVNCAPTLILKIIKDEDISVNTSKLFEYIHNREEKLESLMESEYIIRSEAKDMFIKSLYSAKVPLNKKGKKIKNNFFQSFDAEIKSIQLSFENRNVELKKIMKITDRRYHSGKLMCNIVQKLESELLNKAITSIDPEGDCWKVPIFDGFLLSALNDPPDYDVDQTLNYLKTITDVEWSSKPMDESFISTILDMDNDVVSIIGDSDKSCGDQFIEKILNNNFISCNGVLYLLCDGSWICNEKDIKSKLKRILGNNEVVKEVIDAKGESKFLNVSKDYTISNNFVERGLVNNAIIDDNFIDRIWEDSLGKIYFKNGHYDFDKMEFLEDGDNTFVRSPIELNLESNVEIRNQIYEKILYPIFTVVEQREDYTPRKELMRYMMNGISKMMAGRIEFKKWFLATGERDSGKGVLADLLNYCFGGYIKFTDSSNFKMRSGDSDAKSNSWIIDYQFKRIAICSEISVKENSYVDGTLLKKFCSGGDTIEGRKNYQDEIEFRIQCGLMIFGNDMPPVNPSDAYEKCDKFDMKSKFLTKEDFNVNESNNYIQYYEQDDSVKTEFIKNKEVQNEFILMLIEAYNDNIPYPKTIKDEIMCDMEEEDDEKILLSKFVTNNDGFITNKEIKDISTTMRSYSALKIKKILKTKLGAQESKQNDGFIRGLKGISFKETHIDIEELVI